MFKIGDNVEKVSGYKWPGEVRSVFTTKAGAIRVTVECTAPEVSGALHIFAPEQLRGTLASKQEKATLAYLATPYTKYKPGIERAFVDASQLAARLIQAGINIYSPIAHSHPIAVHGGIDPLDQKFWYEAGRAIMAKCDVLIVAHMDGWQQSSGVAHEIAFFVERGLPIFDCDPVTLRMERRT